jgi:hypothetical protein
LKDSTSSNGTVKQRRPLTSPEDVSQKSYF